MPFLTLLPAIALTLQTSVLLYAESPEIVGPPAPAAPHPTADRPTDTEPRWKGTGLVATTAVLGATSLGITIARSAVLKKNCPLDSAGGAVCTYDINSDLGLAATQWGLNFAAVGTAPGAGSVMGRYHAWKDAGIGKERKITGIMGGGGALVGLGSAGVISSMVMSLLMPKTCLEKELQSGDPLEGDRCLLKAFPAWTMTNWASFAMVSSGAAMLAYGSAYKKRKPAPVSRIQLSPYAGRTYAGIGFSGQF
jgi:hypothetical protein